MNIDLTGKRAVVTGSVPDVDVLVNNAGIFTAIPVFEIPDAEWLRFFEVNVRRRRPARHCVPTAGSHPRSFPDRPREELA